MTDSELYTTWFWSLGIATLIILIAAGLLITVLITARRIQRNAEIARDAVESIARDTEIIWELKTTNNVADDILNTATEIEESGERIVAAIQHEPTTDESRQREEAQQ